MSESVYVNVYDMTDNNKYTFPVGLGIFHSSIQVYGREYSFGGHESHVSGIFNVPVKTELPGTRFRQSIKVGETGLSKRQVEMLIMEMGRDYAGRTYNIVTRNCNHFTDDLSKRLCNQGIPGWINRLAYMGSFFSCLLPAMDFGPVPVAPGDQYPRRGSDSPGLRNIPRTYPRK